LKKNLKNLSELRKRKKPKNSLKRKKLKKEKVSESPAWKRIKRSKETKLSCNEDCEITRKKKDGKWEECGYSCRVREVHDIGQYKCEDNINSIQIIFLERNQIQRATREQS
jgi:hypothetical protein